MTRPPPNQGLFDRRIMGIQEKEARAAGSDFVDEFPRPDKVIKEACAEDRVVPLRRSRLLVFEIGLVEFALPAAEHGFDEIGAREIVLPPFQPDHPLDGRMRRELKAVRAFVGSELQDGAQRSLELFGPLEKKLGLSCIPGTFSPED